MSPIITDGRIHRFRDRNDNARDKAGWYVRYEHGGAFGCWRCGIEEKWRNGNSGLSDAERRDIDRQIRDARISKEAEQKRAHRAAAIRAQQIFASAQPVTDQSQHPYLVNKRLEPHGVRRYGQALCIPLYDVESGELVSLQFIRPDGTKRYLTEGRTAGCSYPSAYGTSDAVRIVAVDEGFATNATIQETNIDGLLAFASFSDHNLLAVATTLRRMFPAAELLICADDDWRTKGNPGVTFARAAAKALGAHLAIPQFPANAYRRDKDADFNDLAEKAGIEVVREQLLDAMKTATSDDNEHNYDMGDDSAHAEPPRPLFREIPAGEPFPLDSLGMLGAAAAYDLYRATQAPTAICGQSILATMNLAVMGHIDVKLPHGEVKPVAEYFATIGESGIRKTSADNRATAGVLEHQNRGYEEHRKEYFEYESDLEAWEKARSQITSSKTKAAAQENRASWKQQLIELGEKPEPPASNTILIGADPTYEGMHRFFREGGGVIAAQFTSEGGAFVGGHSMSDEARLRTATGLSLLWDGAPLPRLRANEKHSVLRGRRLALHILIQPRTAQKLFNDPELVDQGLLTRILAAMPDPPQPSELLFKLAESCSNLDKFSDRVMELLGRRFKYLNESRPRDGLSPTTVVLDDKATRLWIAYHDDVQAQLAPGRDWHPIKGLAGCGKRGPF